MYVITIVKIIIIILYIVLLKGSINAQVYYYNKDYVNFYLFKINI